MTNDEWTTCEDLGDMLVWSQGKVSDRKLRLFACACGRRVLHRFEDPVIERVLRLAEGIADGVSSDEEKQAARSIAKDRYNALYPGYGAPSPQALAVATVMDACFGADAAGLAAQVADSAAETLALAEAWSVPDEEYDSCHDAVLATTLRAFTNVLREIVRFPGLACSRNPMWDQWNNGLIINLANKIYESAAFGDLPVLADAVEECGNADLSLIHHFRSKTEHYRGCWALDCVLGKE